MSKTLTLFSRIGIGDNILSGEVEITAGKVLYVDETFTSEDVTIASQIDVSALKAIYILSDANLGVVFNASGGPHDFGLSITAGVPFVWHNASGLDNPFESTDVVSTTPTQVGDSCRFQMIILTDPTP